MSGLPVFVSKPDTNTIVFLKTTLTWTINFLKHVAQLNCKARFACVRCKWSYFIYLFLPNSHASSFEAL